MSLAYHIALWRALNHPMHYNVVHESQGATPQDFDCSACGLGDPELAA
jgi:hypothetical protein